MFNQSKHLNTYIMKNLNKLLMAALILSTSLIACDDDDDVTNPGTPAASQTIVEIAVADARMDSLVVALTQSGLASTFTGSGTFTVFAPTNQAFVDLLASNPAWNRIADIDQVTLTGALLYHVLPNVVMAADIQNDTYVATSSPAGPNNTLASLFLETDNGVTINNSATVIEANVMASNGVIHVIDAIITPQNVVELALNDDRFSSLVAALQADSSFNYVATLSGAGPFTVFAPTNAAFQALLDSDPTWNTLADIPTATLAKVLEYHVVTVGNVRAGTLTQGQVVPTLEGSDLTVDLTSGAQLQTANPSQGNVNIIVTDVQGTNGVIHAVDQVLLPVL
tara:strand:- start:2517 stop:3530 length:1014 start_codon:yes stop_codon:yes gene_type:complete